MTRLQKVIILSIFSVCMLSLYRFSDNITDILTLRLEKQKINKMFSSRITYGKLLEYVELGWVKQLDLYDNSRRAAVIAASPELGNQPQYSQVELPIGSSQLIQKLKEYNVDFDARPAPKPNLFVAIAVDFFVPLIFFGGLTFLFQNSNNLSENSEDSEDLEDLEDLDDLPTMYDKSPNTRISFNDIAGIDEAKAEFEEIVSFLEEPERYTVVGAKIPKGVLLVGPPGTGKTLLAKAIANEADVPFYSTAGPEFVEMFVGMGAARIRELFTDASENTPCIVFIDEIDAIGRERGVGIGGGNDEREQTLNQLLVEMDGFKENKGVIVVGATNRVEILDTALLRPGRFDRQITIGLPNRLGRLAILKVHARNKRLDNDILLDQLATRTAGFSGADLANLLNESAILATRYKKQTISKNELDEAADRIIGGIPGTVMEDTKNKRLIAYHEVGHAIVGSLLKNHNEVEKVTLVPRGKAKGLTWFVGDEEEGLVSRIRLLAQITTTLGGRAAERIVFGEQDITTGAGNDLQTVTRLAREMVTKFGMSTIGPVALESNSNEKIFLSSQIESLLDRTDIETCKIINNCEKIATKVILDNRVVIDVIVEKLLESETITGEEFRELLQQYTPIPKKI